MNCFRWMRWVLVVMPLVITAGTVLQGCTLDMCPTEEDKAAAKANGTELVESEDCLGNEQKKNSRAGGGGAGGMPSIEPENESYGSEGGGDPVDWWPFGP